MPELSEGDQQVLDDIQQYGRHIVHVLGEDDLPPFSYSVGLFETYDHPEVIIIGLRRDLAHIILNNIGEDIKSGHSYPALKWSDDILENYNCLFVAVDKANYREYVGYDLWYYDGDDFPLLQCIYPSGKGIYPWEDAWPEELKPVQPVLGTVAKP